MSRGPDDEYREWVRRLRDQSRRDAESIVPRPDYPVYGLAAPTLAPAVLFHQSANGFTVLVVLLYGPRETLPAGEALVCRHGAVRAARLIDGPPGVIVTIRGTGPTRT